jgi:signal transduction histidine kinase
MLGVTDMHAMATPLSSRTALLRAATVVLALTIFVADALTPPDCVVSGLYVLVVLIAGRSFPARQLWYVVAACVFLTVLAQLLSHRYILSSSLLFYIGIFNVAVSIVAITLSAYLIQRGLASEQEVTRARADLAHISRVTTMGELTASIAHEVNQPIAGVVANAGACLRWLDGETPHLDEARAAAARIVRDGTRAAEIVSRIRGIFSKSGTRKQLTNVNLLIRETAELLGNEASRHAVSLNLDLMGDVPTVIADPVQLQQVIVNLASNGIEAMRDERSPRVLTISSRRTESGGAAIAVRDSGKGLPAGKEEDLFQAFYTTKPQGTGLGLSISRSIVEAHHGDIVAESNPSGGAVFRFVLPAG